MVSVCTRFPATHRFQCMTFIDVKHATQQIAMQFVSIALRLAMLDMMLNLLGMTGMFKFFVCKFLLLFPLHSNL